MRQRIRVAYVAHTFMVGGAEEMVLNLVRHLPSDRYEPMVCAIHEPGPIGHEIAATGVPFRTLGRVPGLRDPLAPVAIYRYLREVQPHLIHTVLLTASLDGRAAAIVARVPVVIGTEVNIYEHKRRRHAFAERMLMARTDCVVASAESVKRFYLSQVAADPARVEVIYNAVDFRTLETTTSRDEMRSQLGVPADAMAAAVIARLTDQKGHTHLLDAMATTPGLEELYLVVVGDGPLRPALEAHAASLGLTDRIRFLGSRRDLGNLLGAVDLFVLPSLWEGLPLSLILAMGRGLPVAATAVAGIPEVVRHDETGLLVPPGDTAALGVALTLLVRSADDRRRLGCAARNFVLPRFGVDRYVAAMSALYDRLLTKRASL